MIWENGSLELLHGLEEANTLNKIISSLEQDKLFMSRIQAASSLSVFSSFNRSITFELIG